MRLVAESFTWPFRGPWVSRWLLGMLTVALLPVLFIPLLGYAIEATRAAERDPSKGPPPWKLSGRLFWDGAWTAVAVLVVTAPFAIVYGPIIDHLPSTGFWPPNQPGLALLIADVLVLFALALPWGCVLLLLMPYATARFAATGRMNDIFDFGGALRQVRGEFARWNATAAAIVTGWAVGIACAGLLCVGLLPGVFYAILVSAHAAAALHRPQAQAPSPG